MYKNVKILEMCKMWTFSLFLLLEFFGGGQGYFRRNYYAGTKTQNIGAHVGQTAELPCRVDKNQCGSLHSVKWYKDASRIYVLSHAGSMKRPEGDDAKKRMTVEYNSGISDAILKISDISIADEAIYKCEITYLEVRESCDVVQIVNLTTLVKPESVKVLGPGGIELKNGSILGPKIEGDEIDLVCETSSGKPIPRVNWYNDSMLISRVTQKMAPTLYMSEISPSCRSVLLTARMLNLTLKIKKIDLIKEEQMSPCFLKINPQHTIPTLIDNGFVIWDSHAIMAFLVGKYGNEDLLYSRDDMARALIDQRLHFESGVVSYFTRSILNPMLYENRTINIREHSKAILETYSLMEKFLRNYRWIAGNNLTIADLSLIPPITSLNVLVPIEKEQFPKLKKWIENTESLRCYDANENGLNQLKNLLQEKDCCC